MQQSVGLRRACGGGVMATGRLAIPLRAREMHKPKLPSISFNDDAPKVDRHPAAMRADSDSDSSGDEDDERGRGRGRAMMPADERDISPFRRATSRSKNIRGQRESSPDEPDERSSERERPKHARHLSTERGLAKDDGMSSRGAETEEEDEDDKPTGIAHVTPTHAFVDDEDDEDDEADFAYDEHGDVTTVFMDEELYRNTEANASEFTRDEVLAREPETLTLDGEGQNLVAAEPPSIMQRLKARKSGKAPMLETRATKPVFERNRCTVTLTQGDPAEALKSAGRMLPKVYLVASDMSDESLYAIQWAIGTVLRQGDELLVVSVMETDSKLDSDKPSHEQRKAKPGNQKDRQVRAYALARQATSLLERTRLHVKIHCQAIHAKNARHMVVDMIDYREPNMVIIGSRGLTALKEMLLGSVSNYIVQKSSSPVMVTRRPLRMAKQVSKPKTELNRGARVPLSAAQIEKESHAAEHQGPADQGEGAEAEGEGAESQVGTKEK